MGERGLKEITEVSSLQRKQETARGATFLSNGFVLRGGALCNGELLHEARSHMYVNEAVRL